jgi:hypothetical protein
MVQKCWSIRRTLEHRSLLAAVGPHNLDLPPDTLLGQEGSLPTIGDWARAVLLPRVHQAVLRSFLVHCTRTRCSESTTEIFWRSFSCDIKAVRSQSGDQSGVVCQALPVSERVDTVLTLDPQLVPITVDDSVIVRGLWVPGFALNGVHTIANASQAAAISVDFVEGMTKMLTAAIELPFPLQESLPRDERHIQSLIQIQWWDWTTWCRSADSG